MSSSIDLNQLQTLKATIHQVHSYKTSMKWLLNSRQEEFWAIFDQAAIGVAQLQVDGQWLLGNEKICSLLGYTPEELTQQTLLSCLHPDDLEIALNYLQTLADLEGSNTDTNNGIELRLIPRIGEPIWVQCTLCIVQSAIAAPQSFIALIQDIPNRKQPESNASSLPTIAQLDAGNEMTHELNNILTPILGITQLLQFKLTDIDEQTEELLHLLESSTKRAAAYVKQISASPVS